MQETKEAARQFIENGGKCMYGFGLWNGPRNYISKEEALQKLDNYNFGMGFYELHWMERQGETILVFKELHENDLW